MWVAVSEGMMSVCLPNWMLSLSMNGFALWCAGVLNSCLHCLHVPHTFLLKCGVSVKYSLWEQAAWVQILALPLTCYGALGVFSAPQFFSFVKSG